MIDIETISTDPISAYKIDKGLSSSNSLRGFYWNFNENSSKGFLNTLSPMRAVRGVEITLTDPNSALKNGMKFS